MIELINVMEDKEILEQFKSADIYAWADDVDTLNFEYSPLPDTD